MKPAVLTGNKINKVSAKVLMVKMLDMFKKTIDHLLNFQKTAVEGLKFKVFTLSAPSVWADNPEMYMLHFLHNRNTIL
ncbi:hypothetical protein DSO57_1021774 [Entomophthora muscae]|uniref:Uncharacterized protein n=1 Tax=Entomophthora muscae TaxID=34485 RepID=A0ACC2TQZ2_9FUNG|nr:hypothetical protein DSO57_1021774 [Entomophthora muscae]